MKSYKKKLINNNILYYKIFDKITKDTSSIFLKEILEKEYDIKNYNIYKNKFGKPYLKDLDLYFNISHKKNMIGIAISNKEIGLDIEFLDGNKICNLKLLENYFTENERKIIGNDIKKMLNIWTKKESFIKLVGKRVTDIRNLDLEKEKVSQDTFIIDNYICTISYF